MQVIGAVAVRSTSPREKVIAEMIWLHPHPLPSSPLSFSCCLSVCRRPSLLMGEGGMEEEPNHTAAILCKSFNTLCGNATAF
jgi:hypothetical protein